MSNYERQVAFRKRNPGYYGRLHRRQKAELEALLAEKQAAQVAAVKREPLMLPAPVEVIEMPGVNTIPAVLPDRATEPVVSVRKIDIPSAFGSFFAY